MSPERLEAFSDGVFAVIITITVLDIKVPAADSGLGAIVKQAPLFASYALSFANVGIYWNNHHHMFQAVKHVNGNTLWLNLHLLFWLSFLPFSTNWVGDHDRAVWPTVLYGVILLGAAIAFAQLSYYVMKTGSVQSTVAGMIGRNPKMLVSVLLYVLGIGLAFVSRPLADLCYLAVAVMWFLPSRQIENALRDEHAHSGSGAGKGLIVQGTTGESDLFSRLWQLLPNVWR